MRPICTGAQVRFDTCSVWPGLATDRAVGHDLDKSRTLRQERWRGASPDVHKFIWFQLHMKNQEKRKIKNTHGFATSLSNQCSLRLPFQQAKVQSTWPFKNQAQLAHSPLSSSSDSQCPAMVWPPYSSHQNSWRRRGKPQARRTKQRLAASQGENSWRSSIEVGEMSGMKDERSPTVRTSS